MQNAKSTGALLQHISSNITKLLEVIEDVKSDAENESWATVPTLPRLVTSSTRVWCEVGRKEREGVVM